MSGGRIVCEVAHRALAHDEVGAFVAVNRRVYVLGQDGAVEDSASMPRGLGYLIGAGPHDELFFATSRSMLKDGEAVRVSVMRLR